MLLCFYRVVVVTGKKIIMIIRNSSLIVVGFFTLIFGSPYILHSQKSSLNINEAYGKYTVGFQSFLTLDKSRSFSSNTENKTISRPIQVCVWYPAKKEGKNYMKYEDYFFLKASETADKKLTEVLKKEIIETFIREDQVSEDILKKELGISMNAVQNTSHDTSEKFPILIYGPSWWSTAFENALLCEFLASHGYVVVSSPSVGPETREMPISRIGVETQARDMEFLLSLMDKIPNSDVEKVAVSGFSLGGLSNVLMLARNKSVDAWIGIDPSIHEAYDFFKESPYEDYTRFTKPTLFINSLGYMTDLPFYDQLIYSDAYMVNLPKLQHTDLASQFIKLFGSNDIKENVENRVKGYNIMSKYVLSFLDGVFKKDLDYDLMTSNVFSAIKIDSSYIEIKSKKGLPVSEELFSKYKEKKGTGIVAFLNSAISDDNYPYYPESDIQKLIIFSLENNFTRTAEDLMNWYQDNYENSFHGKVLEHIDFNEMLAMFSVIHKDNNGCEFNYYQLNHTAQVMSMSGKSKEALPYFILNTKLYPDNYQAFFNLGIGYYRLEDFDNAKLNFKKCLELNPNDRFKGLAEDMLKKSI